MSNELLEFDVIAEALIEKLKKMALKPCGTEKLP